MTPFLKKQRTKLMSNSSTKIGSYLKYAFGEIILVVIGILIALYIKGWYQEVEEHDQLNQIGSQIIDDLRRDTANVNRILNNYQPLQKDFLGIINKSYNLDSLKKCQKCAFLISSITPFTPGQNGYVLLKDWKAGYSTSRDSIIHDSKLFYTQSIPTLELIVEMIKDDVRGNLQEWRDEKDWYAHWVNGVRTDSFYEYMSKDPIFRNKVANFYLLLYRNYFVALRKYRQAASSLADRWEKELQLVES